MAEPPDIVFAGHITRDLLADGGWRPGGSVVYGAHLAARWGFRPAVLTAAASLEEARAALPAVATVHVLPSTATTTFRNLPGPPREQHVSAVASPLTAGAMPPAWREASAMFVAPVIGEVAASFVDDVREAGQGGLIGVGLQGWLRLIDAGGRVRAIDARNIDLAAVLRGADAAFVSDEDLSATDAPEALMRAVAKGRTYVLFTKADHGSELLAETGVWAIAAAPARRVDPTGAGDVFATAYLLALVQGEPPPDAARLATAAAACSIEGEGIAAIPTLEEARQRRREAETT